MAGIEFLTALGTRDTQLSATQLRAGIAQPNTPTGDLLRTCLMVVIGYKVGARSLTYRVDSQKLMALRERYLPPEALPAVLAAPEDKHQYLATVKLNPFESGIAREEGTRKGHRWYNAITSMKHEVRAALIGHGFDYDITASMAPLLYQRYLTAGGANALPTWARLVQNRTAFRAELSLFTGLPLGKIKAILASILNGGQVVRNRHNGVWQQFNSMVAACSFDEFKAHPSIAGLIEEGRVLYETLVPIEDRVRVPKVLKNGKTQVRAKSRGWHQYNLYEAIEDEVMSVVSFVVGDQDAWFIHDGFMTREPLTSEKLKILMETVKQETGYSIELEETELKANEVDQ